MEAFNSYKESDFAAYGKNRWQSKKEHKAVARVRDRFSEMKQARMTSCFFAQNPEFEDNDINVNASHVPGSSWAAHWNEMLRSWFMYKEYIKNRTNLKSPIVFAPVEAAMAEFQGGDQTVLFTPRRIKGGVDDKVKLHYYTNLDWEARYQAKKFKNQSFHNTIILGTDIPFWGWQCKKREVSLFLTGKEAEKEARKLAGEKKEEVDHAKTQMAKDLSVKKEEIVEWDDCVYIPTYLFEIYIDPAGRALNSPAYEATDLVWRQTPSVEQFKIEFLNSDDPYVKRDNVKNVQPAALAQQSYGTEQPFFQAPKDIMDQKRVELLRYYNKFTDEYIVVANDVIVRDGPLPYNHKQIPFTVSKFFKFEHQFYGFGLPAVLSSLQSEDETLRNMIIDQAKINFNPPLFVNSEVWDDVLYGYEDVKAGKLIEITGSTGAENIRWFEGSAPRTDFYPLKNSLREDAIQATGINPIAYSVPKAGEPVRNNLLTQESTMKMIKKGIDNWGEGFIEGTAQLVEIRKQMYPDLLDKAKAEKKPLTILTERTKLTKTQNNEGQEYLEEEHTSGDNEYELDEDFLDVGAKDIKMSFILDTLVPMSTSLRLQTLNQAMTQLVPLLINPQLYNNPAVSELIREYVELNGLSEKIIEQLQDRSNEEDMQWAMEENMKLDQGEVVQGRPGVSTNHLYVHMNGMLQKLSEKDQIARDFGQMPEPQIDPMTGQPQLDPKTMEVMDQLQKIDQVLAVYAQHMQVDQTPKDQSTNMVMSMSQPPQPEQMQPQGPEASPDMMGMEQPQQMQGMNPAPQGGMGTPMGGGEMMGGGM